MRLNLHPEKRLLTRVLVTSFTIITLVGFALAWLLTLVFAQSKYNDTTTKLIAELPVIAAEFQENNLVPITQAIDNDNIYTKYLMATCDSRYHTMWESSAAIDAGVLQICERYKNVKDSFGVKYINNGTDQNYFVYALSVQIEAQDYHLVILKDASKLKQELDKFDRLTLFRLAIVLGIAYLLLTSAAYWSLLPLRRLKLELQQLKDGQKQSLENDYPVELTGITNSLNQLVSQSEQRQSRYQNAMNDLAHSLKTRLAATLAIIDDKSLTQEQQRQHALTQVNDMDQLVKYQLKRAMLGRKGLISELTPLEPVIKQITDMLDKLYQSKAVQLELKVAPQLLLPMEKGDVMELVGNILENAYRLCISKVRVTAITSNGNIQLFIEDDGPGVEDSIKQKIILRGVRADTQSPGQGIGLAVCQEIIDSYGGTMSIEQSDLLGAQFALTLPAQ
ncbi:GHKL domain-containing protein [Shewanella sp. WXL01]|uniref:ATP-binding protein n=1 Tax=Shewanella sp. WXL01 TaxID=2709721 RepID=UPI001438576A|nr:ATP-binding protein [Shewanella sp. WXL01]NKF50419.1 GHKL domain-containing protein [Shewanella sp. WXL01]